MKNALFLTLLALLGISCSKETARIVVENTLDFDRTGEMVEVETAGLKADFGARPYVLKDEKGAEVACQLLENSGSPLLIFQADVPAHSRVVYTLEEGKPAPVAAKTHARQVPERKDDFAWENDLAAYRMYGPALAKENPSNGVDLWLKCTGEPVMDKLYADELERGISYHVNHGLGLDCYDVKHTTGAGGIAPYTSQLWIGNHYDRFEILENGPLRSVFTLTYDSVQIEDAWLEETITITADAGSLLNKAAVSYKGSEKAFRLTAGIFLHQERGVTFHNADDKVIAYAENAASVVTGDSEGRNYVGVYMPDAVDNPFEIENHYVIPANYQVGNELVYYFGGGWSKWKFPSDEDWFNALRRFSQAKQTPLKVNAE
jgi:hypothetical protein